MASSSPSSSPSPERADLEPGTTLDHRYRLDAEIARGGTATVYRATDTDLERTVAVKVVTHAGTIERGRLEQEAELLAAIAHANLVRLFDAGDVGDRPYLVLEHVEGETLADRLGRGPLPAAETERIGQQLASALSTVHDRGVVHRDVKPSNVLLEASGRAVLGDFGIARLVDDTTLTATATIVGTAGYLAPEQVRAEAVDGTADVYSLGLVLLECLTGDRAFRGPPIEAALARLSADPAIPDDLDSAWQGLISAMTARRPDDRPSAQQVERHLGAGDTMGARTVAIPSPFAATAEPTVTIDPLDLAAAAGGAAAGAGVAEAAARLAERARTLGDRLPDAAPAIERLHEIAGRTVDRIDERLTDPDSLPTRARRRVGSGARRFVAAVPPRWREPRFAAALILLVVFLALLIGAGRGESNFDELRAQAGADAATSTTATTAAVSTGPPSGGGEPPVAGDAAPTDRCASSSLHLLSVSSDLRTIEELEDRARGRSKKELKDQRERLEDAVKDAEKALEKCEDRDDDNDEDDDDDD